MKRTLYARRKLPVLTMIDKFTPSRWLIAALLSLMLVLQSCSDGGVVINDDSTGSGSHNGSGGTPTGEELTEPYTRDNSNGSSGAARHEAWWNNVLNEPDQLRQRVAIALSEIFFVSDLDYLLDEEARNGHLENPDFGKLRAPVVRLAHVWRALDGTSGPLSNGIHNELVAQGQDSGNPLVMRAIANAVGRASDATASLHSALQSNPLSQMQYNGSNKLAKQLHLVARLIASREELGMQKQVFFVLMGGWDTHSDQAERTPDLLQGLNEAIGSFQKTIDGINMASSVSSFTASDFGRTLTSNGNGTDHGRAGHSFVFGGAVDGGRVIGYTPDYSDTDNPDDAGEEDGSIAGRLIPTISVNQYAATLSRWMGVSESDLSGALPDLQNFAQTDLGFMRS